MYVCHEVEINMFKLKERFKSNLEFRNQIIVSSIKFRKGFNCTTVGQASDSMTALT